VRIHDVTITNVEDQGIDLIGMNISDVWIYDSVIENSLHDGIRIVGSGVSNVVISNVEITNTDEFGIFIASGNSNITIEDSTLTNTGTALATGAAISLGNDNTDIAIRNLVIDGSPMGSGLQFGDTNTGVTVDDVQFLGSFGAAVVRFTGSGNEVTGADNINDATGTFCDDVGGNAGSSIEFEGGTTCP
jgi:hypothetical protein